MNQEQDRDITAVVVVRQEQEQGGQSQSQGYTPPENGIALDPITEVSQAEPPPEGEQSQEQKE